VKKPIPPILEEIEELKELLKSEKRSQHKQRLQALYLLKTKQAKTRIQVASLLGVHRDTVGRWLNTYQEGGLSSLLDVYLPSGKKSSPSPSLLTALENKLRDEKDSFRSYKEAWIWLRKYHDYPYAYSTCHALLHYKLQAKLKVPRKSHKKKDEKKVEEFKESLPERISKELLQFKKSNPTKSFKKIRFWTQDETRLGLIPIQRRKLTLKGVKPIGIVQYNRENYYLYGMIEPSSGESFFLELPQTNAEQFQIYLEEFAKSEKESLHVLFLDNGKFHKAKKLKFPENVLPIYFEPYAPELNPTERFWKDLKEKLANEVFESLEALQKRVAEELNNYSLAQIQSLTSYPYFINATSCINYALY
jgi:transposase